MDFLANQFGDGIIAARRARLGVFVLEDIGTKKALEERGIEVRRIRGERDVRLVPPRDWSLVTIGKIGNFSTYHCICDPRMTPVFITYSAHFNELPSRGYVKKVSSEDFESIVLGNRVEIQPLKVNNETIKEFVEYEGISFLIWEKLPGVNFLCVDEKPITEIYYYHGKAYVRIRGEKEEEEEEEKYAMGRIVEETEDDEMDYDSLNKTHKYSISYRKEDYVELYTFLKRYCRN